MKKVILALILGIIFLSSCIQNSKEIYPWELSAIVLESPLSFGDTTIGLINGGGYFVFSFEDSKIKIYAVFEISRGKVEEQTVYLWDLSSKKLICFLWRIKNS